MPALSRAITAGTAIALFSFAPVSPAQDGAADAQSHLQAAFDAYNEQDYDGFVASLEIATELNPHSLTARFYLARGYALTGQSSEAMDVLDELAYLKVNFGYADHRDFESLRETARFQAIMSQLEADLTPVSSSRHRHTINQLGIIPEGIAIDPATERTFLSSMRSGDIYVLDADNQLSKFATVRGNVEMAAIGLFVDAPRNLLWAVGATFEMTQNYDADAETETGVFGFDLSSGVLSRQYLAGDVAEFFNDLTVAPDGTIYISGSDLSTIPSGGADIRKFTTVPEVTGSNGIVASPDGNKLFVSSYPVGVAVVDLPSGTSRFLDLPDDATLYGVDGMYWHEGDLVAIQNGIEPWRLIRVSMNDDYTAVTKIRVIELANADIDPTTGAIIGNVIHYVGQGPAPEQVPSQFAENLLRFLGETIVMTATLD